MIIIMLAAAAIAGGIIGPRIRHAFTARSGRRLMPAEACARCNAELAGRRLHRVTETYDDPDWPGAGTGVSASFCRAHCPGGCRRGCRHRAKLAAA